MATVYIITAGSYSDYHICGVTLDKDKAERMKVLCICHYGENEGVSIEEYETDKIESFSLTEEELNSDPVKCYEVEIIYDVSNRKVYSIKSRGTWKLDKLKKVYDERIYVANWITRAIRLRPICYYICIREEDKDKAKKIAIDRFYQKLVEKYGL